MKKTHSVVLSLFLICLSFSACKENTGNTPTQITQGHAMHEPVSTDRVNELKSIDKESSISPDRLREMLRLPKNMARDSGFAVAVIDTGIYPHPDLTSSKTCIVKSVDYVNNILESYDDNGHGTAISGIIHGVAPFVDLISLKTLDYNCKGSLENSVAAINWVIENKDRYNIRIINMSVATPIENSHFDPLTRAAENAYQNGIVVVASVGNYQGGDDIMMAPALGKSVLAVGSASVGKNTDNYSDFGVSDFSAFWLDSKGVAKPDLVAPGERLTSLRSDVYYRGGGKLRADIGYSKMLSGTSEATAVVSGIVANLMLIHPSYSQDEIVKLLLSSCKQISGNKSQQGHGLFIYREE